jgi:hypothetical protein
MEKWHPVVHSREKVQFLGFEPSYGHLWLFLGGNHEKHEILEISTGHTSQLAQADRHTAGNGRATSLATFDPPRQEAGNPFLSMGCIAPASFTHSHTTTRVICQNGLRLPKKVERC